MMVADEKYMEWRIVYGWICDIFNSRQLPYNLWPEWNMSAENMWGAFLALKDLVGKAVRLILIGRTWIYITIERASPNMPFLAQTKQTSLWLVVFQLLFTVVWNNIAVWCTLALCVFPSGILEVWAKVFSLTSFCCQESLILLCNLRVRRFFLLSWNVLDTS